MIAVLAHALLGARRASCRRATATPRSWAASGTRLRLRLRDRRGDLLVAIIAAIALPAPAQGPPYQDPSQQVAVRREERVRLVSMPPQKE